MKRLGRTEFWLLVFLGVLLLQSALGLFYPAPDAASGIDVIVRTSAAGIFGYFLSCGSPRRDSRGTLIVGAAGLFCLVVLLVYRAVPGSEPSSAAAVAQLRDFVSGSVGFLTGGRFDNNDQ